MMKFKKLALIVGILAILLLTPEVYAADFNTLLSQLLASSFRAETFEEYKRLSYESLEIIQKIDLLILENPSLEDEQKTREINNSILGKKISALKEASKGFIDNSLAEEKYIALVSFSDQAKIDSLLSRDRDILYSKIDLYRPQGRTCIHCGIIKGVEVLSRGPKGSDMLLISDGHSTGGSNLPLQAAEFAKSRGIRIYTIALGDKADEILLRNISKITGGKFYKIECERKLKEIYREIAEEVGSAVLVSDISDSMEEDFLVECLEEKDICNERCLMNKIISLLEPLYVFFIILVGFYLIFLSVSPESRAKAKSALTWLILSMCLVTLSPLILILLFSVSHALSEMILSLSPENSGEIFSEVIAYTLGIGGDSMAILETHSIPFVINPYLLLQGIILMLKFRYYMVLILAVLFPFTLLFYPFPPTRGFGRLLLEQTLLWTFAQVFVALVFVVVAVGINLIPLVSTFIIPFELKLIMELTGLLILLISPFIIIIQFRGFLP